MTRFRWLLRGQSGLIVTCAGKSRPQSTAAATGTRAQPAGHAGHERGGAAPRDGSVSLLVDEIGDVVEVEEHSASNVARKLAVPPSRANQ